MDLKEELFAYFIGGYEQYYTHMDTAAKKQLRQIAPMVFAKWYYTTIMPETILTPANILEAHTFGSGKQGTYEPVCTLRMQKNGKGIGKYICRELAYTIQDHPMIADLKTLIAFCEPDCTVDERGCLSEEDTETLLPELFMEDHYYVEYLMLLAQWMGLVEQAPAIHTHKIRKSSKMDAFLQKDNKQQLQELLWAGCAVAAEQLTESLDLDAGMVDAAFFYHYLEDHQSTDNFFLDFFALLDVNLETIWHKEVDEMSEEDHALMSSFLFLGLVTDKWFFLPMGLFFHVIRPMYFMPFSFSKTINSMASLIAMGQEPLRELLIPPSYYSLSILGQELTEKKEFSKNLQSMPTVEDGAEMMRAVEMQLHMMTYEQIVQKNEPLQVVRMRICLEQKPEMWKEVEIPFRFSLDLWCHDIAMAFAMEDIQDYVVSVPNTDGVLVKYAPEGSKKAFCKTTDMTIEMLEPKEKDRWYLHTDCDSIIIDVLELLEGDAYRMYPRIHKQSKKITEWENSFDPDRL